MKTYHYLELLVTSQTLLGLRESAVWLVRVKGVERSDHGQRSASPSSANTVVHAGFTSPARLGSYHHQVSWGHKL